MADVNKCPNHIPQINGESNLYESTHVLLRNDMLDC